MPTALITGPTSGIGLAFAQAYAARGHDLLLTSRDEERLGALAVELERAHGIRAEVLAADLADRDALAAVADRARDVDVLVNNAGFGLKQSFLGGDIAAEERLLDVLCRAVLVLTHAAANGMAARGHGTIVNVSSVAGWMATGHYSAAKSYVTVLSEGLHAQLAHRRVTVIALCPGMTRTEFHERAGMDVRLPDWVWLQPAPVVQDCLADARKGRAVSVPGWQYKIAAAALKALPRAVARSGRLGSAQRRRTGRPD